MKKLLTSAGTLLFSVAAFGGTVVGTKHDLKSVNTPEVCVFCHAPHNTNTNDAGAPLWNRAETTKTFILYNSSTMNVAVSQPGGVSKLCLSCHDGVVSSPVVHGTAVYNNKHYLASRTIFEPNCSRCHSNWSLPMGIDKLRTPGTDLSNDHPISIPYPTPAQDPAFKVPTDALKGWGGGSPNEVKLYAGMVECSSCHNVHSNDFAPFLRKSNASSALCLTCHAK